MADDRFKIDYLANHPDYIEACAAWHYTFWGIRSPDRALSKSLERYRDYANKNTMPMCIIALDTHMNVPVGMASLDDHDSRYWDQFTPWVGTMFVHEQYRGAKIAIMLMERLEEEAKALNIERLYLTSSTAEKFYLKLGYQVKDTRQAPELISDTETLFYKDL